jgi:hypothetical protein
VRATEAASIAAMSSSLLNAKNKLTKPPEGTDVFPLVDLPKDRGDPVWEEIRILYKLKLSELSALKNFVMEQQQQPNGKLY